MPWRSSRSVRRGLRECGVRAMGVVCECVGAAACRDIRAARACPRALKRNAAAAQELLKTCKFVAFDEEMTGIRLDRTTEPEWGDTVEQRYAKMCAPCARACPRIHE